LIVSGAYDLFKWGKDSHEGMVYANCGMLNAYTAYLCISKLAGEDPQSQESVREQLIAKIAHNRDVATRSLSAVEGDKQAEIVLLDNTPRIIYLGHSDGVELPTFKPRKPPARHYFMKLSGTAANSSFMLIPPDRLTRELETIQNSRSHRAWEIIPKAGTVGEGLEGSARRMAAEFVRQMNISAGSIHTKYARPLYELKALIATSTCYMQTIEITK
jgi:hypothetical protein